MSDHAALEKGERSNALGPVDDLVGHDKVTRFDVFAQAADSGEGDDCAYAERTECSDIRP